MEQIKIVRLKTGMDIIGIISEETYKIIVKNAMVIDIHDDFKNQKQILALSHWASPTVIKENICSIFENDILCRFDPTEEFLKHYEDTIEAMHSISATKKQTDEMSDEEIYSLIEAMEEREHSTLQ